MELELRTALLVKDDPFGVAATRPPEAVLEQVDRRSKAGRQDIRTRPPAGSVEHSPREPAGQLRGRIVHLQNPPATVGAGRFGHVQDRG